MKYDKVIFCLPLFIIGIILIIASLVINYHVNDRYDNWVEVDSTITSVDCHQHKNRCKVFITYTYDGQTYNVQSSYSSNLMKKGDTLPIKVNPDNPSKQTAQGFYTMVFLAMLFMGIIIIISGFLAYRWLSKKRAQ